MIHHHAYRQSVFRRHDGIFAIFALDPHLEIFEVRQIFCNRIIKGNFAFLNQDRHAHTAEPLGLGTLHEYIIHAHRDLFFNIRPTETRSFLNTITVKYADRARKFS